MAKCGGFSGLTSLAEDPTLQEMLLPLLPHQASFALFETVHVISLTAVENRPVD